MDQKIPRMVVIGGGVSGLATACSLLELSRQNDLPIDLLLIESSRRLGGIISTDRVEDCLIENGPDAIFTEKPFAMEFCKKIGLESELIQTNRNFRTSLIAFQGKLHPLPKGFHLIAPSQLLSLMKTPLLSWEGKFRILCELFIPDQQQTNSNQSYPQKLDGDESIASFVQRRLGKELLERIVQPIIGGIYSADLNELSLKATFPIFLDWEKKYGSVIKGVWLNRKKLGQKSAQGARYSLFVSFKEGMQTLIDRMAEKIPPSSVLLGTEVSSLQRSIEPGSKKFKIVSPHFQTYADGICLAIPAFEAARVLKDLDAELSLKLHKIPYSSGAVVNLIYRREEVPYPLNVFGFVVPKIEKRYLSGCTFSSVKFLDRSPEGKVIFRAFLDWRSSLDLLEDDDHTILSAVKLDLKYFLGIEAEPLFSGVYRHPNSIPKYCVGHLELVKEIEDRVCKVPGLTLAGNSYYGIGIPDAIRSGEIAAKKMIDQLLHPSIEKRNGF